LLFDAMLHIARQLGLPSWTVKAPPSSSPSRWKVAKGKSAAAGLRDCPFTAGQTAFRQRSHLAASGRWRRYRRLDQTKIDLYLDDVLSRKTAVATRPTWKDGQRVMKQSEITVRVVLGRERLDTV
jgi:hypothetical protein